MTKSLESSRIPAQRGDEIICVDMGTTNTRAWLVVGNEIVARESAPVGVRDSARTGNTGLVQLTLKDLFRALQTAAQALHGNPAMILGAGMITSSLGLLDIDHVSAPAGAQELAAAMHKVSAPQITELPIWLTPGVRTGPAQPEVEELANVDMIRGEETLCVGFAQLGVMSPYSTLLNLGSHWKAITLDGECRIATSFTTLSGELIHAVQEHTVLSSAVPQERFTELDLHWLELGREQERMSGLSRALFCVRILEQKFRLSPIERSSFLLGAIVGADLTAARENHKLGERIVIAGSGAATEAWKYFLVSEKRAVTICNPQEVEKAFVVGLLRLGELAGLPN